jgi:Pyridine nucleotide-disulphide oxidoreductase
MNTVLEYTPLLVVGAGPYGLATAAAAQAAGVNPLVVGEPMEFWRRSMPKGMLLRSSIDWHLDAQEEHTLAAYVAERGLAPSDVDPIPLELFIDYADWFRAGKGIRVKVDRIHEIRREGARFHATLEGGGLVVADAVVATPGVGPFTRVPEWVAEKLPAERYSHTSHLANLARLAGARCLIVGGRQSAFEWAALLAEAGVEQVHVVHRHDPPSFEPSDWSFVEPLVESTLRVPGWYRTLPPAEQHAIERRFWTEGRLKLEPWLAPRLARPSIRRWPRAEVTNARELAGGAVAAELTGGEVVQVDHVILATGYAANLAGVPYLAPVLGQIDIVDGFPALDEYFQTSLSGLYVTGFAATRDFGPVFGFVRGSRVAASIIARGITGSSGDGNGRNTTARSHHSVAVHRSTRSRQPAGLAVDVLEHRQAVDVVTPWARSAAEPGERSNEERGVPRPAAP